MRPTVMPPLMIRGHAFGGAKPLFCVPLMAKNREALLEEARAVHAMEPDVVEWRADVLPGLTPALAADLVQELRGVLDREALLFTLRSRAEGGESAMAPDHLLACMQAVLATGAIDLLDVELSSGSDFLGAVRRAAGEDTGLVLSYHNFVATPEDEVLDAKLAEMVRHRAAVAKFACTPQSPDDVLRLLAFTLRARLTHPALALCTISMGGMGALTRVAGFLYGSDMSFAVGCEPSAPGQISLAEARSLAESLLRHSMQA